MFFKKGTPPEEIMPEQEVVDLMKSSNSPQEWDSNTDKVRRIYNGYPRFWFRAIVLSGVAGRTAKKWGGDGEIKIR